MENQENRGVILPQIGKDWIAGSTSQIAYAIVCDDWGKYLPVDDNQFGKVDWQRCVSESYAHTVATKLNFHLSNGDFSADEIKWLTDNKYIVNGKFDISIRALAKMSGTTTSGNSQNAVAECARTQGLVPNSFWPSDVSMDWVAHYLPVPQFCLDLAQQFLKYVQLPYEWLITDANSVADYKEINQQISYHLRQAPLQFTCPLCPSYDQKFPLEKDTAISSCGYTNVVHAMMIWALKNIDGFLDRVVRDSYPPYDILFANNYPMPYILKIVASPVTMPVLVTHTVTTSDGASISTAETPGWWEAFIGFLKSWKINFTEK